MKFILNKDQIAVEKKEAFNSGSVNYYEAEIEYDDSWQDLNIEAIIIKRNEEQGKSVAVINNHFYIDNEYKGFYSIGFVGYRIENEIKTYQISTNLIPVFFNKGAGEIEASNKGDIPTPSEWEVYIAQIQSMVDGLEEQIPTKYSDLENDNHTVQDENYVHTDNNFSNEDKDKLDDLENYDDTEIKADIQEINTNLLNYSLITETGSKIDLEINSSTYELVAKLYDKNNNLISTSRKIDLPIESMIVGGSYDSVNKKIILTLDNGNTIDIPVGDLISGLQAEITSENKLESDLVDDTNQTNKFVTTQEKETWNNKLDESDLADFVKNTDYASSSKGGVVKVDESNLGIGATNSGKLLTKSETYANYLRKDVYFAIGKGTLENVITGKQLVNQQTLDESQEAQDEKITAIEKQIPTGEVNDTSITLTDSADYKVKEFGIEGNTEQATRSGKNLFNKEDYLSYNGYFVGTGTSNIVSESSNKIIYIPCSVNTQYTVSKIASKRFGIGYTTEIPTANVRVYNANNNNSGTSITITTGADAVYLVVYIRNGNISGEETLDNIINSLQIEEGSTATPYEEYGASPSPEYPSPVNTITGDVEVKVQNGNLFDKNNANILNNIYLGESTLSSSNGGKTLYIPCKANTTYTVSKIQSARFSIATTNELPKNSANIYNRTQLNSATNLTLTSDANSKYLVMFYYLSGTDTLTEQEILNSIMLVEGTTAGEYIPHAEQNYPISLGDIELCKIGEYQDKIFKAINGNTVYNSLTSEQKAGLTYGNWYKYGAVGKRVFDGSETNWDSRTGLYFISNTKQKISNNGLGLCNYFTNSYFLYTPGRLRFGWGDSNLYFYVDKSLPDFESVTNWKTWLSTHNTIVYYVLATPEITQITDTTLINQLNSLEQAYTYKGVTHIDTDVETKPYLKIVYRKDIGLILERIENLEAKVSLLE